MQSACLSPGGRVGLHTGCVGLHTGTPLDDRDCQVPFAFTGELSKLTLSIDRPKLTPADEKRLMEAQRNNKASE